MPGAVYNLRIVGETEAAWRAVDMVRGKGTLYRCKAGDGVGGGATGRGLIVSEMF